MPDLGAGGEGRGGPCVTDGRAVHRDKSVHLASSEAQVSLSLSLSSLSLSLLSLSLPLFLSLSLFLSFRSEEHTSELQSR